MPFPFFLRLAYIGTDFHGWQIQTHARSVQAELWKALRAFDPEAPMPQGTGRTDAGVHAKAQGVLVRMTRPWEPYRLLAALNAHLSADVRVMEGFPVDEAFWPRHHAVAKRYVYRLNEGPAEDPFERDRRWHVFGAAPLDLGIMARAAEALVGKHDFSSFRHQECAAKSPLRTLYKIDVQVHGAAVDLVFEGNRFLMHQVRIMTGTLVDIGKGRIARDAIPGILAARDRSKAGFTAPPHGLCLEVVWYESCWSIGPPCPWGEGVYEASPQV
jgi:tRNA pseudouridine38-40 synthase